MDEDIRFCPKCGREKEHTLRLRPDTPHLGSLHCKGCGRCWGWKPKNKEERTNGGSAKRNKSNHTPHSLGIEYCQMCLRPREMLGKNEIFLVHHVKEIQDGGRDTPSNIWVLCSSCHGLVHHMRTYLYRHFVETEVPPQQEIDPQTLLGVPWEE